MSGQARYTPSRAKLGSPIVHDTEGKRSVLVCLRDTDMPHDAADEAAMLMARFVAQALNRRDAELKWKQQQEGGKR